MVALDPVITMVVGMLATYTLIMRQVAVLDAGIVSALIAFPGTVGFASYLERG
ncbi:MAG TPA: monovalent cation/H+ antiporter complex subunit F [Bryobacteraceae bacterium]|nr:monovalent cation/H+ antiporter complex subunit F [Bryobacteraceae bacterium]